MCVCVVVGQRSFCFVVLRLSVDRGEREDGRRGEGERGETPSPPSPSPSQKGVDRSHHPNPVTIPRAAGGGGGGGVDVST
jgi:hypothetical protein